MNGNEEQKIKSNRGRKETEKRTERGRQSEREEKMYRK
jgi:hypothetical protein